MIKGKFLLAATLAFFLASCGDDDESQDTGGAEVKFTAGFVPMQTSGASTRLTTNDNWAGLADRTVAVEIDGVVKPYTVDEQGNLTSQDPFYWGDKTELTVNAWYPYNEGIKPEIPVVKADQSGSGYWESDHLEVVTLNVPFSASIISFRHRNTQMVCDLKSTLSGVSYNNVTVKYLNLQNVEEGTTVRTGSKGKALIVPQTIPAGTEFMEITLPDERSYTYTLEEDMSLGQGVAKGVELEVSEDGIKVTFKDLSSWDMSEDTLDGNTIENKPDTNADNSWNSEGADSIDGSTIENKPNTDTDNSWDSEGKDTIDGSTIENKPNTPDDSGSWDSDAESWEGSDKVQSTEI